MIVYQPQIGRSVFKFATSNLPYGVNYLSLCCKYTKNMPAFVDPGDCPCTWGQQMYDGRFVYDESKVRLLRCDSNKLCTYRVCFHHRYTQYYPKNWWVQDYYYFSGWWIYSSYWYYWYWSTIVTAYESECCWQISIPSTYSSYLTSNSAYNSIVNAYISPYPREWAPRIWANLGSSLFESCDFVCLSVDLIPVQKIIRVFRLVKNPALLTNPGSFPLAGSVSVYYGKAYNAYQTDAKSYCDAAGELGQGMFLSRRPVVSCYNYDGLATGMRLYGVSND